MVNSSSLGLDGNQTHSDYILGKQHYWQVNIVKLQKAGLTLFSPGIPDPSASSDLALWTTITVTWMGERGEATFLD
eukprot:11456295-Ditylum_brightwellii.AAC.1